MRYLHFILLYNGIADSSTQITNFAVAELQQAQTRRWVVAWSHDGLRLPDVSLATTDIRQLSGRISHSLKAPYPLSRNSFPSQIL